MPSFTLKFDGEYLPNGVVVKARSLKINYDQAGTLSTADFTIIDKNLSGTPFYYTLLVGKIITIYENGVLIWGGTLDEPETSKINNHPVNEHKIKAICHGYICTRLTANQSYPKYKISDLFKLICNTYLSTDGIFYTSSSIMETTTEVSINCPWTFIDVVFNELVDLIGWQWYIGPDKCLYLNDRTVNIGPAVSEYSGYIFASLVINDNRSEYRNRQVLKKVNAVTDETLETASPTPNNNRSYFVRFPLNKKPKIYITRSKTAPPEEDLVDPRYIGINGLDTGMYWYWSKGDSTITLDNEQEEIQTGYFVVLSYFGQYEIDILETNNTGIAERQAIEGGSGIYDSVENGDGIEGILIGEEKAQAFLNRYSRIAKSIKFDCIGRNFKVGQVCDMVFPTFNINSLTADGAGYLVQSLKIQDMGTYLKRTVSFVDGEVVTGWINFYKQWLNKQTYHTIREDALVEIQETVTEVQEWAGTVVMTKIDCLYPADDPGGLYPGPALYPGTIDTTRTLYD